MFKCCPKHTPSIRQIQWFSITWPIIFSSKKIIRKYNTWHCMHFTIRKMRRCEPRAVINWHVRSTSKATTIKPFSITINQHNLHRPILCCHITVCTLCFPSPFFTYQKWLQLIFLIAKIVCVCILIMILCVFQIK